MTTANINYPSPLSEVIAHLPLAPLGPGRPVTEQRATIEAVEKAAGTAFPVGNRQMWQASRAGLWLAFNFLDQSHEISQSLDTVEGSFWHALMHRREPDAWNSKYWWRKVGAHPVFAELQEEANRLGWKSWDPAAFVDECEKVRDSGCEREMLLREIQMAEWRKLFGWCWARQ